MDDKKVMSITNQLKTRRNALRLLTVASGTVLAASLNLLPNQALASSSNPQLKKDNNMDLNAFVYTELQISVPFEKAPWRDINISIKKQPGFINKTWLSGIGNNSVGGFYAFDSIENANKFVTGYFPGEASNFGVAHNTRVFDANIVKPASEGINSVHFGATLRQKPGAFVYTEVQVNIPFEKAPWQERNPILKQQKGLIAKTWLSGLHTNTIGGIDAFDTIENAQAFAVSEFPKTAAKLNAAFYTRVFDGAIVEEASRDMNSPFYI